MHPRDAEGMASNVDPYQTATLGALYGSANDMGKPIGPNTEDFTIFHLSQLIRLWHFLSFVNTFFKRACAAIQWG